MPQPEAIPEPACCSPTGTEAWLAPAATLLRLRVAVLEASDTKWINS
jgi:hypothetical protein